MMAELTRKIPATVSVGVDEHHGLYSVVITLSEPLSSEELEHLTVALDDDAETDVTLGQHHPDTGTDDGKRCWFIRSWMASCFPR